MLYSRIIPQQHILVAIDKSRQSSTEVLQLQHCNFSPIISAVLENQSIQLFQLFRKKIIIKVWVRRFYSLGARAAPLPPVPPTRRARPAPPSCFHPAGARAPPGRLVAAMQSPGGSVGGRTWAPVAQCRYFRIPATMSSIS